MDLPIDHFRLLGVSPASDAQTVLRTLDQRLDRVPDQGFTTDTLQARAKLLHDSADLLSDSQRRHDYEAELTALAELVREQAIRRTFEEVPHAVEAVIEEIDRGEEPPRVRAVIWVESESQKGILVGKGGRMVKAIGTAARAEIEELLGERVHLDLSVKVRRGWRSDEGLLDRLGID